MLHDTRGVLPGSGQWLLSNKLNTQCFIPPWSALHVCEKIIFSPASYVWLDANTCWNSCVMLFMFLLVHCTCSGVFMTLLQRKLINDIIISCFLRLLSIIFSTPLHILFNTTHMMPFLLHICLTDTSKHVYHQIPWSLCSELTQPGFSGSTRS